MAFAVTGFATVAQNYISRQIASNFYKKAPLMALLGALTIGNNNKDSLEIGRPDSGEILSGGPVSSIQRKRLGTVNSYLPRIQGFTTNNSGYRTGAANDGRTSLPDVANKSTSSHGQAMQYAADFRWFHLDTPILIWHEDKIRAGQEGTREGQGIAMGQLVDEATEVGMQDHLDKLCVDVYDGTLTQAQQAYALWPNPHGVINAIDTTGYYANVNRATEPLWQAKKNTTLKAVDLRQIIDNANIDQGLKIYGNGAQLILTGANTLYKAFKAQVIAQRGEVMYSGLPAMAKMGVKKEILQIDDTLVMYDPFITDANTVLVMDLTVWKFMIHPQFNFKVTPFVDNTKTGIGKEAYDYGYVSTRAMLTCDNPRLNVKYTAIGT